MSRVKRSVKRWLSVDGVRTTRGTFRYPYVKQWREQRKSSHQTPGPGMIQDKIPLLEPCLGLILVIPGDKDGMIQDEIRGSVARVMDREKLDGQKVTDYASSIELAKKAIMDFHFDAAVEHVRKAVSFDPARPEAFNLLGVLEELRGNRLEAQKHYRAALSLDPSYGAALANLERLTSSGWRRSGGIDLGAKENRKRSPTGETSPQG